MSRLFNFSAGPAMLPPEVMEEAQREFLDYQNSGASIVEVSHRAAAFRHIHSEAVALVRELLGVPDEYQILFLSGGATGQMAAAPMNLLGGKQTAGYAITGLWSQKAAREAAKYCEVAIAADTSPDFSRLPAADEWRIPADAAYLHYADNETVHGVEFPADFAAALDAPIPLVADMSSNIMTRPVDVSRFGMLYAGAQKNLAPAGVTLVIVRDDLIGKTAPYTPSVWDFAAQAKSDSMLNTPPVFQIYLLGLALRHLKKQGGIAAAAKRAAARAKTLYDYLDSTDFYRCPVTPAARSRINAPFFLPDDDATARFVKEADEARLIGLKGHRAAGGIRASMYNAMPLEGVVNLVDFMRDFERRAG
jgi:phosphoserine aminotransferase